ncbi:hypothetical protein EJ03DRAFT_70438 [Teratosphaeria nubilosa]|uniref:Autophagy-related protein 29 n=1 Tax=Teratosphaeria nubilosa TaxID=161662 RepID=A0A6G1LMK3_9PEZI|nr:hypothetical protein EJ03DRAFT_70438 [Teratosphaeria nubilosa]
MSPSSSVSQPPSDAMPSLSKQATVRNASSNATTNLALPRSLPVVQQSASVQGTSKSNVHYTCIIRLPFARNGFEDPPMVHWDVNKDKALWKLISKAGNAKDLDWPDMAARFQVDLSFLLQQAAWLYERHFEGMRKQMQRLGSTTQAPSPSLTPETGSGSFSTAAAAIKETRLPSAITTFKATGGGSGEGSPASVGTPRSAHAPPGVLSRTPSTNTVTQSKMLSGSGRGTMQRAFRGSSGSTKRPTVVGRATGAVQDNDDDDDDDDEYALGHDGPDDSASEEEPPSRSQAFGRRAGLARRAPPRLKTLGSEGDVEDYDDAGEGSSEEGYLPFASKTAGGRDDPAATLKEPRRPTVPSSQPTSTEKGKQTYETADSSASSASSSHHPFHPSTTEPSGAALVSPPKRPGPLSPKQKAQLANLSPRSQRQNSDTGSPSMGSSFSDLDDASVTQSALEDALLSHMQRGGGSSLGIGSMATIASRVGVGRLGEVLGQGRQMGGGSAQGSGGERK